MGAPQGESVDGRGFALGECRQRWLHSREALAKLGSSRASGARWEQGAAWVLGGPGPHNLQGLMSNCVAAPGGPEPLPTPSLLPTKPGRPPAPRPAAPHLSSPAGSEFPSQGPAPHASSGAPPSCQPEAAGAAGSCSSAQRAVSVTTAPPGGPAPRFQARLSRPLLPAPPPAPSCSPPRAPPSFARNKVCA